MMTNRFMSIIAEFNRNNPKEAVLLTFGTLFWAFTFPLAPILLGSIIDQIKYLHESPGKPFFPVIITALTLVLVQFLRNCNYYLITKNYAQGLANSQYLAVQKLFSALCQRPYRYFTHTDSGTLSGKINNVLTGLDPILMSFYVILLPQAIAIFLAGLAMSFITPLLSIFFWCWAAVIVGHTYKVSKISKMKAQDYASSQSRFNGHLTDTLINIETLLTNAANEYELEKMNHIAGIMKSKYISMRTFFERARFRQGLCTDLFILITMITLLVGYQAGHVSIGDFAFVFALIFNISGIFHTFGSTIADFHKNLGKLQEGYALLDKQEPQAKVTPAKHMPEKPTTIEIKSIKFGYNAHQLILDDFTLSINKYEKIGIVGASGCGKSTLLKLLLRLYDCQSGTILIGGKEIKEFSLPQLRAYLSFVPQNIRLFNRSLRENILYGCGPRTEAQVIEACKLANCHQFITHLSDQYETLVGEQGAKLSGGQNQRIAIARAILQDAPILLLDEATSALDSETEASIQQSFAFLMEEKTALVVAHRLSTLKEMDRIVVINEGKVAEAGTHSALLSYKSIYSELWKHQSGGFIEPALQ